MHSLLESAIIDETIHILVGPIFQMGKLSFQASDLLKVQSPLYISASLLKNGPVFTRTLVGLKQSRLRLLTSKWMMGGVQGGGGTPPFGIIWHNLQVE